MAGSALGFAVPGHYYMSFVVHDFAAFLVLYHWAAYWTPSRISSLESLGLVRFVVVDPPVSCRGGGVRVRWLILAFGPQEVQNDVPMEETGG